MTRPLRILHAITRLNLGGAARSVLELAAAQQRRGHQVLVVAGTIPRGEASMEHLADALRVPWLKLTWLQREVALTRDAAAVQGIRSLIAQRRPQVLHTHTSKAGVAGRIAALLSGRHRPAALVHTFHGHVLERYFTPGRQRLFRWIEHVLAPRTSVLIAVSEEVRADLVRLGVAPANAIAVVRCGFDFDAHLDSRDETRKRVREQLGAAAGSFVVGWIGRLTAIKRPLDLIRVLHLLRLEGVNALLAVVGDGEARPQLQQLALELGVAERVRFMGYRADVSALYGAFDALLLTSANEGAPVSAIESLAAGRPVVATAVGGTPSVVDDAETGYLVPLGQVKALACKLALLARDPELARRLGQEGASRVRSRFSSEVMVTNIERLYDRYVL